MENLTRIIESRQLHGSSMLQQAWTGLFDPKVLLAFGAGYLLLVRILRYQRITRTNARFPTRASLAAMTVKQAQEIVVQLGELEMPYFHKIGLSFALFRTYGIPTISSLLVETSVFSKPATATKRYADTSMLISEQLGRPVGTRNWIEATSRMNCIHQRYQISGKISNEDMLYTLALFAREPILWIKKYDWRELSDVERCAMGIYWCGQGEAMGIQWRGLPTYDAGKKWRDGLHFLQEWMEWTEDYEVRCMVPADTNFETAEQTTAILLWGIPKALKPYGKQVVVALMDDRLRKSMKYEAAPSWLVGGIYGLFRTRAFLIRHLAIPRYRWTRFQAISSAPDKDGRMFSLQYDALPYYVKPSFWNRWGPGAMLSKLNGLPVPGDEGQRFCPMGYSIPDLGPSHGKKEQKTMEAKVAHIGERGHVFFEGLL